MISWSYIAYDYSMLVWGLIALGVLVAQADRAWTDPSPHRALRLNVDSQSVGLEVLDWGGAGRPVLFVGCYLSAHVFDDIAPKLTDRFRVYAVTRRGVGASDRPPAGYDPQRRADDILEVIAALGLEKPVLIGNSCGGAILHTLGAQHPDRVGGLVYLDAAEDPTLRSSDYDAQLPGPAALPEFVGTRRSVPLPEAERRLLVERPMDPVIRKAIVEDHNVRPDYARIRVPVLAIYGTTTLDQALKDYPPKNDQQRAAFNRAFLAARAMLSKWQRDLIAGVPAAWIVELPGAGLYMFVSHEADIIRELRAFVASLQ